MSEIRLAIAGVGNCASAFIQGLYYYERLILKILLIFYTTLTEQALSSRSLSATFCIFSFPMLSINSNQCR